MTGIRIKLLFEESDLCHFLAVNRNTLLARIIVEQRHREKMKRVHQGDHTETIEAGIHTLMKGLMNFSMY